MFFCEYCEIIKNVYFFIRLFEGVFTNVFKHSQENTCTRVSFLINVVASLQLKPIFIWKEVPPLVFPWQLAEIFNNNFFKEYCYKKRGSDIRRKSNTHFLFNFAKISVFQHSS